MVNGRCGGRAVYSGGCGNGDALSLSERRRWVGGTFGFDERAANSRKMAGAGRIAVRRKCHERKEICQNGVRGPSGAVRRKSNPSKALTA
jgi:hypothetical protein